MNRFKGLGNEDIARLRSTGYAKILLATIGAGFLLWFVIYVDTHAVEDLLKLVISIFFGGMAVFAGTGFLADGLENLAEAERKEVLGYVLTKRSSRERLTLTDDRKHKRYVTIAREKYGVEAE